MDSENIDHALMPPWSLDLLAAIQRKLHKICVHQIKHNNRHSAEHTGTPTTNLIQQPDFDAWLIREVADNGERRNTEVKHL